MYGKHQAGESTNGLSVPLFRIVRPTIDDIVGECVGSHLSPGSITFGWIAMNFGRATHCAQRMSSEL